MDGVHNARFAPGSSPIPFPHHPFSFRPKHPNPIHIRRLQSFWIFCPLSSKLYGLFTPKFGHFMTSSSPSLHLSVYTSYLDGHRAFILTSQAVIRRLGLRLSKSPSGLLTAAVGLWASSSHFIFADKVILPSLHCARDQ